MRRMCWAWFIASAGLLIFSAAAGADQMERLASDIAEEIRSNLLTVEMKVSYVGMNGDRAYLTGDLGTIRPGQGVVFYRDGAAILSVDSSPQVLGRESVEVGRGRVSAVHDRTAWVQVDTPAGAYGVERGDWAFVRLESPVIHAIPFFVDDGAGGPTQDGRSRILRSLLLYNIKRRGMRVNDVPVLPGEVDASGLPTQAALQQFDTTGVLLIGRILPNPRAADELVVGIAVFDLALREMRFARSYQVKTLGGFTPTGARMEIPVAASPTSAATTQTVRETPPPPREIPRPQDPLKGILRMYIPTTMRLEWPPKTPADFAVLELVSVSLPDLADEWVEHTPGEIRIDLPERCGITAAKVAAFMTTRSQEPSSMSLIGTSRWEAKSDTEIWLTLDTPLTDIRERLEDPQFHLISEKFEPLTDKPGPYRFVERGVRTAVLEKTRMAAFAGLWTAAPDTIILTVERDPRKRAKGFDDRQTDIYEILDEEFLKYGPASMLRVLQSSPEDLMAVAFNLRRDPMASHGFRRTVALAVDRRSVLEVSLNQRGVAAEGILPPGAKGVAPVLVKLPERNVDEARTLAQSRGDTGRIGLMFPVEEPHYGITADAIRTQLKSIGLDIELQALSSRAYADRLMSGEYDLAIVSLAPAMPYRLWMQQQFSSFGKNNFWGYYNTIVDALLSEGGDVGASLDLIQSDLPVVPLFWLSRRIALAPRVTEAWPSPLPKKFFSSIRLK